LLLLEFPHHTSRQSRCCYRELILLFVRLQSHSHLANMVSATALLALIGTVSAGTVLWDGRANDYADSSFLDKWSWSSQVGPYQWYIHGESNFASIVVSITD